MIHELKRTYLVLLIPALIGLSLVFLGKYFGYLAFGPIKFLRIIAVITFILSVTFAIGLPIFFRTLFAHKNRERKNLSKIELLRFERRFLHIALVTPYLALVAYLFEIPKFHFAGTFLMALYAVYYYYPSKKRIQFEKRIFRVKE